MYGRVCPLAASRHNTRYGECERASLAWCALHRDLAAVQFYDHFDDSQSKPLTAGATGMIQRDLIETLEDALPVFGSDAAAAIKHLHGKAFPGLAVGRGICVFKHAGGNGHAAAGRSETYGVADEV